MIDLNYKYNKPEFLKYRKELRANATSAERFLWRYLKNRQIEGTKFRRQFSIHIFILDFYCPEYKLAIELDGQPHFTEQGIKNDQLKENYLRNNSISLLRFENKLVFNQTESVLMEISEKLKILGA